MTTQIFDDNGDYLEISPSGAIYVATQVGESIDTFIQDQTSPSVDLYFTQAKGSPTALTSGTSINDSSIIVDSVTNITSGDYVGIFSGTSLEGRYYFAEVLSLDGNTVTLDTPLDFAYDAGDNVISTTRDMNVDGTLGNPEVFVVQVGGVDTPISVDITRFTISMVHSSAGDDGLFGNLAALTNGIVMRRIDGDTRNLWNAKSNSELSNLAGIDVVYSTRSGGPGSYGTKVRITYGGQDKRGVVIRLEAGDKLELLIQDPLSGLGSFRIMAQGHLVVD